jgi:hypothetical protein
MAGMQASPSTKHTKMLREPFLNLARSANLLWLRRKSSVRRSFPFAISSNSIAKDMLLSLLTKIMDSLFFFLCNAVDE